MSKRTKFILISTLIAFFLWLTSLAQVDYRFGLVLAVAAVSYILSVWVLFDDLKGIEWIYFGKRIIFKFFADCVSWNVWTNSVGGNIAAFGGNFQNRILSVGGFRFVQYIAD